MERKLFFGAATSSYQIEGAAGEDGRVPSIWDTYAAAGFCLGDDGSVACDHYHRFREDVELLARLGVDSYRFSIAWPRLFSGPGKYNERGMRFYRELLLALRQKGIRPAVTLYHWDLPQWAMDRGGWLNRECVDWFEEFCVRCYAELDGLADLWITVNEPWCAGILHTVLDGGAPGGMTPAQAVAYTHHLLLAHGRAVRAYRRMGGKRPVGIALNMSPGYTAGEALLDKLAVDTHDGQLNRWFMDALFRAQYPLDMVRHYWQQGVDFRFIRPGDMELVAEPIDFLGVNYYNRELVGFDPRHLFLYRSLPSDYPRTDMGWDISPNEFVELLKWVHTQTPLPIIITENGSAWRDTVDGDGRIHDVKRQEYLLAHLEAVMRAREQGIPVTGYYAWSFLDNFEWRCGYSQRFGLVYVDYATQTRIPKDSFETYRSYIRTYRKGGANDGKTEESGQGNNRRAVSDGGGYSACSRH